MFCPNCGTNLPDNATFCSNCGAQINNNNAPQQSYQPPQQPYQPYQPYQPPYSPYNTMGNEMPMKWYKFLIYFSLFAGAVLNVISGIMILTGAHYDGAKDYVYAFFGGLQGLDMFIGVASLAMAALQVYTRFRLSGFCKNGPMLLSVVYIVGVAINLIYLIGIISILPGSVVENINMTTYITQLITSGVMVFVNYTYFNKRKHLFQN